MVTEKSSLIVGDILRRNSFMLNLIEDCEEEFVLMDCTGLIAKSLKNAITLPINKLNLKFDADFFVEAISMLKGLNSHLKTHLKDAISKVEKDELSINKIIEKLASTSNPFIHSPTDVIYLESLIYELNSLRELDECLNKQGIAVNAKEGLAMVIDLSMIRSTIVRKLITLLVIYELAHEKNNSAELRLFVEGPEGTSLIGTKEIISLMIELHEKLMLNDISPCYGANYYEVSNEMMARFKHVYFIYNDELIVLNGLNASELKSFLEVENKSKLNLKIESFLVHEREYSKKMEYKAKSMLELLFGDKSDLIADIILTMEKNMITRKEFKNLVFSMGYFKDSEELLNEMIKEDLIEERIIGGMKKLIASSKGLFLAKSHKQR